MDKPLTLHIEDTKNALVQIINESNLHPYILDSIVGNIYNEVHAVYLQQLQYEKKEYEDKKEEIVNEVVSEVTD